MCDSPEGPKPSAVADAAAQIIAPAGRAVPVAQLPAEVARSWMASCGRLAAVAIPLAVFAAPTPIGFHKVAQFALLVGAWFAVERGLFHSLEAALGVGLATFCAVLVALIVVAGVDQLVRAGTQSEIPLIKAAAFIVLLGAGWELLARNYLSDKQRLLVLGSSTVASAIVAETRREKRPRFEVVGAVWEADEAVQPNGSGGAPRLGDINDLGEIVEAQQPDLIVLAEDDPGRAIDLLLEARCRSFRVVGLAHFFEHAFDRVPVEHISPAWFMNILHFRQPRYARAVKRIFDLAVGLSMFVVLLPILVLTAASVRASGRPVIYRQRRLGERGEIFEMLKFRTMVPAAEAVGRAVWAAENDPRVTKIGRFLRRTHLDELPQLWNVVRGEMSLVGPRPERPEFVELLEHEIPFWHRRLLLKPGLTGWAQVHAGYANDCATVAQKLSYDLWYLRHRTLLLDAAIVAKTLVAIASGAGSR